MTQLTMTEPAPPDTKPHDLVGTDLRLRCDGCHSQAFGIATKGKSVLLFCGHHLGRHAPALGIAGWDIEDRTHMINKKPSPSANKEG